MPIPASVPAGPAPPLQGEPAEDLDRDPDLTVTSAHLQVLAAVAEARADPGEMDLAGAPEVARAAVRSRD
jgi:hypothetical protein